MGVLASSLSALEAQGEVGVDGVRGGTGVWGGEQEESGGAQHGTSGSLGPSTASSATRQDVEEAEEALREEEGVDSLPSGVDRSQVSWRFSWLGWPVVYWATVPHCTSL